MIPKILHQVWLGNKPIPILFQQYSEHFKTLHPGWEYKFWNENNLKDTDCWNFIEKAKHYSSKSNIARLYAILNYGGVYSDFDVEWIQNIDHLLFHDSFAAIEPHKTRWYGNAIFGATPNNEWIKYQYDELSKYVNKNPPWGPSLMTIAAKKYDKLKTIDTSLFYPYAVGQNIKGRDFSKSYAVHHWTLSWRQPETTQLINKINNLTRINSGQMTYREYKYIADLSIDKNMLVFGCGKDSDLWRFVSSNKVIFIEHNTQWIDKSKNDIICVKYTCKIKDTDELIQQYLDNNYDNLFVKSLKNNNNLSNTKWDTILVDSPEGYNNHCHGRVQSIFAAKQLANTNTNIIVHDIDRYLENKCCDIFFNHKLNEFDRLGHYKL